MRKIKAMPELRQSKRPKQHIVYNRFGKIKIADTIGITTEYTCCNNDGVSSNCPPVFGRNYIVMFMRRLQHNIGIAFVHAESKRRQDICDQVHI